MKINNSYVNTTESMRRLNVIPFLLVFVTCSMGMTMSVTERQANIETKTEISLFSFRYCVHKRRTKTLIVLDIDMLGIYLIENARREFHSLDLVYSSSSIFLQRIAVVGLPRRRVVFIVVFIVYLAIVVEEIDAKQQPF